MTLLSRTEEIEKSEAVDARASAAEIKQVLQRILESQPFRTSKQCQDLLRYVVHHSLSGDDAALRERVIGSEVFGRKPSYDTNDDPVVRVRAADVRKRLAQYYQSTEVHTSAFHIELLPGSYRVHFRSDRPTHALQPAGAAIPSEPATVVENPILPAVQKKRLFRSWPVRILALALILAAAAGVTRWIQAVSTTPLEAFWAPIVNAKQPALVYLGANAVYVLSDKYLDQYRIAHHMPNNGPEFYVDLPPGSSISADDLVPVKDTFVSVADSTAAVQVTTLLRDWKRPFVLRAARDLSFGDLRNRPSVMIGGFNNTWTLELTNDLPYRFREGIHIVSRDHPQQVWTVPSNPHSSSTDDYALITRVFSSKTGGPLITVSGIGQNGTQASAEFLTNPEKMRILLQNAPRGWENKNMQVVLHVKVVGYLPASVDVVATTYW